VSENFGEYCATGATVKEQWFHPTSEVSLRYLEFKAAEPSGNPAVVFIPGWVSLPQGWKIVLREMTRDFDVYYLETREKISARIEGKASFSVADIGGDIVALIEYLQLKDQAYFLFGSSLGATAILEVAGHFARHSNGTGVDRSQCCFPGAEMGHGNHLPVLPRFFPDSKTVYQVVFKTFSSGRKK